MSNTKRHYSLRIDLQDNESDCAINDKIKDSYDMCNRGVNICSQLHLTLLGGAMTPLLAKKLIENKKWGKSEETIPLEWICFLCWFSIESKENSLLVIPVTTMKKEEGTKKFREYWGNSEYDKDLVEDCFSFSFDDSKFEMRDRRQSFLEWNKEIEFSCKELGSIFLRTGLPFFGSSDEDEEKENSKIFWMRFLSYHYGDDDFKSNYSKKSEEQQKCLNIVYKYLEFYKKIENEFRNETLKIDCDLNKYFEKFSKNISLIENKLKDKNRGEIVDKYKDSVKKTNIEVSDKFKVEVLRELGIKSTDELRCLFGKNGNKSRGTPPALINHLDDRKIDKNILIKIKDSLETSNDCIATQYPFSKKSKVNFLKFLENSIGLMYYKYEKDGKIDKRRLDNYTFFTGESWGKLLSSRSNSINYAYERKCLKVELLQLKEKIGDDLGSYQIYLDELSKIMAEKISKKEYTIYFDNLNGLDEFINELQMNNDVESSLRMVKNKYEGKFGTCDLFRLIGKDFIDNDELVVSDDFIDKIKFVVDYNNKLYKFNIRKIGGFVLDRKVDFEIKKGKLFVNSNGIDRIEIELYDKITNDLVFKKIPVNANKLEKELLSVIGDGEKEVFRLDSKHKKYALDEHGGKSSLVKKIKDNKEYSINLWMQILPDGLWNRSGMQRWRCNIAPTLEYFKKGEKVFESGDIFIGNDYGMRFDNVYACLETGRGDFSVEVDGRHIKFDIKEVGICTSLHKEQSGDIVDELRNKGRRVNDWIDCKINDIINSINKEIDDDNDKIQKFGKDIYYCEAILKILKIIKTDMKRGFSSERHKLYIKSIVEGFFPAALGDEYKPILGVGSLSSERFKAFEELKRTLKSYLSNLFNKEICDEEMKSIYQNVEEKYSKIREDKWKKVKAGNVDIVLRLRNKYNRKVWNITENLDDLKPGKHRSHCMNSKLGFWYKARISKATDEELNVHDDVFGWKVNPSFTSHRDVDGTYIIRLRKIDTSNMSDEERNKINDKLKSLSKKNKYKIDKLYKEKIKELLDSYGVSCFNELFDKRPGIIFVPDKSGFYSYTKFKKVYDVVGESDNEDISDERYKDNFWKYIVLADVMASINITVTGIESVAKKMRVSR